MPKFNENIKAWITNHQGQTKSWPAFFGQKQDKAIDNLFKTFIYPERFNFPEARIYINGVAEKLYIFGQECQIQQNHTSSFKLKLILRNHDRVGPFYIKSTMANEDQQYKMLINQYCYGTFKNNINSVLVFKVTGQHEEIYATGKMVKDKLKIELYEKV